MNTDEIKSMKIRVHPWLYFHANNTCPAEFIRDNLTIASNLIHAAHETGVQKLRFLGSFCIHPHHAPQPLREDVLLTGPLEPIGWCVEHVASHEAL